MIWSEDDEPEREKAPGSSTTMKPPALNFLYMRGIRRKAGWWGCFPSVMGPLGRSLPRYQSTSPRNFSWGREGILNDEGQLADMSPPFLQDLTFTRQLQATTKWPPSSSPSLLAPPPQPQVMDTWLHTTEPQEQRGETT